MKKPVSSKVTVQIASEKSSCNTPHPLPLLCGHVFDDKDTQLLLVYGNMLQPVFEKKVKSEIFLWMIHKDLKNMLISLLVN